MITDIKILQLAEQSGLAYERNAEYFCGLREDAPINAELLEFARLVLAEEAGRQDIEDVEPAAPKLPE